MGAVEHLKTLCCLGLPPESAMIAVTPLLHDIIPHGWTAISLLEPDASMGSTYTEHPGAGPHLREHLWRFMDDPSALISLWVPAFRAAGIGWTLHMQGQGYLESGYYREIEAPIDVCWVLDAMIGDGGRTIAAVYLKRPRSARPFTADDVQRLDQLRPWLAHAFRPPPPGPKSANRRGLFSKGGAPVLSGQLVLTHDMKRLFQTNGLDALLMIAGGDTSIFSPRPWRGREILPLPVQKLVHRIVGAANGTSKVPPRMRIPTAYGVLTLEAKWLVPASTLAEDAAKDPKSCLISITIELREHPIAHAARILRESGATPAQTKVGIQLALGKTKTVIADELGLQLSSVANLTKKLYQTLDVHASAELGTRIWLDQKQDDPRQNLRCAG